jgi:hypothetical protein
MLLIEMRYLRTLQGCTRIDHVKNDNIMREIKIQLAQYQMEVRRRNWMKYFETKTDEIIKVKLHL